MENRESMSALAAIRFTDEVNELPLPYGIGFARLEGIIEERISNVEEPISDIAQQVQLVMSRPQKKSKLFRMAGVIKEPFSSDDD